MHEITVIGPVNGLYHLGYHKPDELKFLSINEFVSQDLAWAMAWKMNRDNTRDQKTGASHG